MVEPGRESSSSQLAPRSRRSHEARVVRDPRSTVHRRDEGDDKLSTGLSAAQRFNQRYDDGGLSDID